MATIMVRMNELSSSWKRLEELYNTCVQFLLLHHLNFDEEILISHKETGPSKRNTE